MLTDKLIVEDCVLLVVVSEYAAADKIKQLILEDYGADVPLDCIFEALKGLYNRGFINPHHVDQTTGEYCRLELDAFRPEADIHWFVTAAGSDYFFEPNEA